MKKLIKPFLLLNILGILSSCGSMMTPNGISAPSGSYGAHIPAYNPTPDSDPRNYICPSSPNILPTNDQASIQFFTVCPYRDTSTGTLLQIAQANAVSLTNPKICIFAANQETTVSNGRHVLRPTWVSDPADPTQPLFRCVDVSQLPAFVALPSTGRGPWNAALTVQKGSEDQMVACLRARNPGNCPPYSFGAL